MSILLTNTPRPRIKTSKHSNLLNISRHLVRRTINSMLQIYTLPFPEIKFKEFTKFKTNLGIEISKDKNEEIFKIV